jgi:hypothetical protein
MNRLINSEPNELNNNSTAYIPIINYKWLTRLVITSVLIVIVCAFLISYKALYELALFYNLPLPHLYPILLDTTIIVFVAVGFINTQNGQSVVKENMLVGLLTLLSIVFNALHNSPYAHSAVIGLLLASIPPLTIFLTVEALSRLYIAFSLLNKQKTDYKQLQDSIKLLKSELAEVTTDKEAKEHTLQSVDDTIKAKNEELNQLATIKSEYETKLNNLQSEYEQLSNSTPLPQAIRFKIIELAYITLKNPTQEQLSELCNTTRQTISKDLRQLKNSGTLDDLKRGYRQLSLNGT